MDILNLISICITGIACIVAIISLRVAWVMMKTSTMPNIVVYLEAPEEPSGQVLLCAKNIGNGIAYRARFDFLDTLPVKADFKQLYEKSFAKKGIPMLVPGATRRTIIHVRGEMRNEMGEDIVTVIARYTASKDSISTISSECVLDFYSYSNSLYAEPRNTVLLNEIKNELHGINDSLIKQNAKDYSGAL